MSKGKNAQTTAEIVQKKKVPGVPFVSGDPRINTAGRPAGSGDPLREIGKKIAETRINTGVPTALRRKLKKAGVNIDDTAKLTMIELIMIELAASGNPAKLQMFLERTYGKVANININQQREFDFKKWKSKFTDSELEQILEENADPFELLFAKLPDVNVEEEENEENKD